MISDDKIKKTLINYKGAERFSVVFNTLWRTRELTIYYPTSGSDTPEAMRRALEILDEITSTKNTKNQRFVNEPIASKDTYPGTWRLITNRLSRKGEPPGIFQILREGWATALEDDEIRIVDTLEQPATGTSSFTQMWPNIDPYELETLSASFTDKVVTDPITELNTEVEGTYAVSNVRGQRQEEDGAGALFRTLTKVTSIADVAALAAATKTTEDKNEILRVFDIGKGEGDWRMCVWLNLDPSAATRTACQSTITDAALVTAFASGYTYTTREFKDVPQNGTASFFVLFRKVAWGDDWTDALKMSESSTGGHRLRESNVARAISAANIGDAFTAAQSPVDPETRNVLMVQLVEAANGERIIRQQTGIVYITTTDIASQVQTERAAVNGQQQSLGRVWWNRTAAAKTTLVGAAGKAVSDFQWSGTAWGAGSTFTHSSYRVQDNGDGSFNVYQVGVVAGGQTWSIIYSDASELTMKKWNSSFRVSANIELETAVDVLRERTIFTDAGDAWDYASESTDYYNGRTGDQTHDGWIDYIGDGKWAAYKETHDTPS